MKLNKFIPLVPTTALLLVLPAIATDVEPKSSQPTTSLGAIHVRTSTGNGYQVNQIRIERIEYTGECPGLTMQTQKAYFISSSTPPAPGRRVVIRNVSPGMDNDPYPYTDRGYDRGQYSQGFDVTLDSDHNTREFALQEGVNQFSYEIKDKNNVLESGSFTVEVFLQNSRAIPRSQTCQSVWKCDDELGNLNIPNLPEIPGIPNGSIQKPQRSPQNCRFQQECSCPSY